LIVSNLSTNVLLFISSSAGTTDYYSFGKTSYYGSNIYSSALIYKAFKIKSNASFLEKKDVRKTSPLTVVIEIELSKTIAFVLFYTFRISFFGICIKVSPKKTVLGLNFE
jgi:hypothetical protein